MYGARATPGSAWASELNRAPPGATGRRWAVGGGRWAVGGGRRRWAEGVCTRRGKQFQSAVYDSSLNGVFLATTRASGADRNLCVQIGACNRMLWPIRGCSGPFVANFGLQASAILEGEPVRIPSNEHDFVNVADVADFVDAVITVGAAAST